jgi:hypothetical protein
VEVVFFTKDSLGFFILMGEICFETGAEVDMPAPEPAKDRFGILVVVRVELAVLARVLGHKALK